MSSHALVVVAWSSRRAAEASAARIRDAYPDSGVMVTDGEVGAYFDTNTGESGYRITLRGPWTVLSEDEDGRVVLRCKLDDAGTASDGGRS